MYAQNTLNGSHKGELSFGARSVGSLFTATENAFGLGAGGQIRFRIDEKFNTEWFGDWMTTDINGYGQRFDAHIGESMMIYPGKNIGQKHTFTPFIVGGFCGDFTRVQTNLIFDSLQNDYIKQSRDRWSFATQLGCGTHYNFTERFDISFTLQYDIHFGRDINGHVETNSNGEKYLQIEQKQGNALEGHTFFTISLNYVLGTFRKS